MRGTIIRIFTLFLMLGCFTSLAWASKRDVKVTKKTASIASPEPDKYVNATPKNKDLPVQKEARTLDVSELRYREGIDVSHYQEDIDWNEVANNGRIGYVFIKASEGAGLEDDYFEYNIKEARKAGLKVGCYHFFRANASIDDQVANMTSKVKKEEQDLLPIVDVEHTNGCSDSEFLSRIKEFLDKITKYYGRRPILYTFVNFYNRFFSEDEFKDYPLMIAFYRDSEPELCNGRKYMIWQYTSHGSVPGIRGNVDRSIIMDGFSFNDFRY